MDNKAIIVAAATTIAGLGASLVSSVAPGLFPNFAQVIFWIGIAAFLFGLFLVVRNLFSSKGNHPQPNEGGGDQPFQTVGIEMENCSDNIVDAQIHGYDVGVRDKNGQGNKHSSRIFRKDRR